MMCVKEKGGSCEVRRFLMIFFFVLASLALAPAAQDVSDPFDSYSMPATFEPKDFYSLSRLFPEGGDSLWVAQNFSVFSLERVSFNRQEWVRWRFNKKTAAPAPALAYRFNTRFAPFQYSIRVFNRGTAAVSLSGTASSNLQDTFLVRPGTEATLQVRGLPVLAARLTDPNVEYDLYLRELTLSFPQEPGVLVSRLQGPAQLECAGKARFEIELQGALDAKNIDLEVRQDPWCFWRIRLTHEEAQALRTQSKCSLEREVPWYLAPVEVTFGLVADGCRIAGAQGRARVINHTAPAFPQMERRRYHGRPAFFRDGKPFTWSGYATYDYQPGAVAEFGGSGANVFFITTDAGRHVHNVAAPTWMGGDNYDFGELEQSVTTALQANPDAGLMMRVSLCLPPFWFNEHPDSLARIRTQTGDLIWEETNSKVPTLASQEWKEKQAVILRKLIQYCASRPWASRVIGFFPTGGVTEEWFAWACNDGQFSDYSPANEEGFRQWCAQKGLPFDRIPDPALRQQPGYDLFPDTPNARWATAYNAYLTETTVDTIRYFASVIKEETNRRALVGTLYGYVVQCSGESRQSTSGNFGLHELIVDPNIDFFTGIPLHTFRNLTGDGYDTYPTAVASIQANGKLYNNEDDLFSWLHNAVWYKEYDPADPRGGAIAMHRRVVANDAIHGAPRQWFSLSATWHHDKLLQEEFARQIKLHASSMQYDRSPLDEVALVSDDTTFRWLTPESKFLLYANHYLLGAIGRTGAPVGVWLLSDIGKLPERIKFVAVVNASAAAPEDLNKLQKMIKRGGRTVMIVGLPGLVDTKTQRWDLTGPARVTGLPIQVEDALASATAVLSTTGQTLCAMPEKIRPYAFLGAPGLLRYADGKTAGAERALPEGGRLIWCGVPPYASEAWLREQMIAAGVHCYAPAPCSVHASEELVSVTSVYADTRDVKLSWPQQVEVTDLFDGWKGKGREFVCPFKYGQTRLFHVTRP